MDPLLIHTAGPVASITLGNSRHGGALAAGSHSPTSPCTLTARISPGPGSRRPAQESPSREEPDAGHRPRSRPPLSREGSRTAGLPAGMHARLRHSPPPKTPPARPSVAVRENADGAHRPSQLCTPTVVTLHTDRPCSTDARLLCVRGQGNMTIYSATRRHALGPRRNGPPAREFAASGPFPQVVAGVGFEPT